jgi:hypothetical protein
MTHQDSTPLSCHEDGLGPWKSLDLPSGLDLGRTGCAMTPRASHPVLPRRERTAA